ncbi:MAG: ATP-dependent helicase UvrD/PcrA [Acidimicrobiaceae bacterium]|jgi:DNA helicase-2/ATP-dependent DNA helicase PcrA
MFDLSDQHLNDQQRAAVEHRGSALLVVAGAGSGKTGVLAHRVAALLRSDVAPERICLLTFSRRAAHELLSRAGRLSDAGAAGQVWGGTFHAVANRVLRLHGRRVGIDPGFSILDGADVTEVFGLVRHDLGLGHGRGGGDHRRRFPRAATLATIYDRVANTGESLSAVLDRWFPWCATDIDGIRAVFGGYAARKRERQLLDYDDLLLCWRAMGAMSGLLSGLFDHVLVDEYQDTNTVQADILAALRPDGTGLTVVGDDAQAIYGFRAATAANLVDFPGRFPGTTIVRLEQNYRSTSPILAVANAVMAQADPHHTLAKQLWSTRPGARRPMLRTCGDEGAEAEAICDSVLAHRDDGVALHSQAVLFRASHHADLLELALARRNIPYVKYGGLRFLEAAHVKDLLGLLRVLDNPTDELAWFRVLRLLDGIGAATARRVMTDLGLGPVSPGPVGPPGRVGLPGPVAPVADPAVTPLARLLAAAPRVPASARAELGALRSALADCAHGSGEPAGTGALAPGAQVARLRQWLDPVVERVYDAGSARVADLAHLEAIAGSAPSRSRFVSDLTLDPPSSSSDLAGPPHLDEDWLVLSTIHSAKGGEWDVVHVLHASDGMFPSDMATGDPEGIDEERRLLYVAVTRARHSLEVNAPVRYHFSRHPRADAHGYAQVSRFLSPEVRALMDETHAEGRPGLDDGTDAWSGTPEGAALASVDQLLAGLWA